MSKRKGTCRLPVAGSPQAIYAELAAGWECHWQAIDNRIALFRERIAGRRGVTEEAANKIAERLEDINQRLANRAMAPTLSHLEYAFVASLNLTPDQQTELRAAAAKAGATCAALAVKALAEIGAVRPVSPT
jgi:hypothetical protein